MNKNIEIKVYQHDWIPGFAAYMSNGKLRKNAKAHVVINLGSNLLTIIKGDVDKKDFPGVIAEDLLHEILHVLEEWAGLEFSEERVEKIIEKYKNKKEPS